MSRTKSTTGLNNLNITGVRSGETMPTIRPDHQEECVDSGQLRLSRHAKLQPRAVCRSNRHRQRQRSNQKIVLSP